VTPCRRAAARVALSLALAVLMGGCVHYPSVEDIGGIRIQPENGRLVRRTDGADFYVKLNSVGKYGDRLLGVSTPVAQRTQVVSASGSPVEYLDVPGASVTSFRPNGPHVALSELTRELTPGEVVIVTLLFQKAGGIGVVSVVE
jgi:copper(I)-binding protein